MKHINALFNISSSIIFQFLKIVSHNKYRMSVVDDTPTHIQQCFLNSLNVYQCRFLLYDTTPTIIIDRLIVIVYLSCYIFTPYLSCKPTLLNTTITLCIRPFSLPHMDMNYQKNEIKMCVGRLLILTKCKLDVFPALPYLIIICLFKITATRECCIIIITLKSKCVMR